MKSLKNGQAHPGKNILCLSFFAFCFSLFLCSVQLNAQSKKDELEKKKEQIQKDIEYTNKLLSQTRKSKTSSLNQLITLNKKISYRNELIATINEEITSLEGQIRGINEDIDSLQSRMKELKKYYSEMLYFAYKNQGAYSRLTFIFSARDFNQAYKRMKYMQQLGTYRLHQRDLIKQTQASLADKRKKLEGVKTDQTRLLVVQQSEKKNLDKEKKEQVSMVNNLASKEKKLKENLRDKQRLAAKLDKMIEDAIRKEIELAKAEAKKKASSTVTADATHKVNTFSTSTFTMTPEALKLSNDFESNRGKLPWPVEQGFISSTYGRHGHPIWKDVVVNNSGIDINSSADAKVRAIFNGKVTKVILVVNKYAVIISHGEYFTVYSNLKEVNVKSDDRVTTKQVIGTVQTDEDDGKAEVHLEIWKGSNKMDPENWIMARR